MNVLLRLSFVFLVLGLISYSTTIFAQETPPKNAPSSNGYFSQAITENVATMQLLGINPIQVKEQKKAADAAATAPATVPAPTTTTTITPPAAAPATTTIAAPVVDSALGYVDTTLLPASELYGWAVNSQGKI